MNPTGIIPRIGRRLTQHSLVLTVLNMALRGFSLIGRFALTFFMASYLPLTDVGLFGLLLGAVNVAPSVSGLGLNFSLNREIVDKGLDFSLSRIRDRLIVSVCMGIIILIPVAILAKAFNLRVSNFSFALSIVIIFLELISFDIHLSLISMRKPILANSLLFLKSAFWVFPIIVAGLYISELRSIVFVLLGWFLGLVLYFSVLLLVCTKIPIGAVAKTSVDYSWIRRTLANSWYIYASDIGQVGQMFLDRFIIQAQMGARSTGIYTLHWSLANSIQVLITAGVLQISLPMLVSAERQGNEIWRRQFWLRIRTLLIAGVPICISVYAIVQIALPIFKLKTIGEYPFMFAVLVFGVMLKCVADMFNYGLYSRSYDRSLASTNVFGLFVSLVGGVLLTRLFGINGAALSIVLTGVSLICVRAMILKRRGAI